MINSERLDALLLDLVRISSPSRKEHAVAERLRREMEALGAEVTVDEAGARVGGTTGNVVARVRGRAESAPPLLLSAHMDTVVPVRERPPGGGGDRPRDAPRRAWRPVLSSPDVALPARPRSRARG